MIIYNRTPHPIYVLEEDKETVRLVIPPQQPAIRVEEINTPAKEICGVPTCDTSYGEINLPDAQEGVYYIVSKLVQIANPSRWDLLAPGGIVRDRRGQVMGCTNLSRYVREPGGDSFAP